MRNTFIILALFLAFCSCEREQPVSDPVEHKDWSGKIVPDSELQGLAVGKTYLPVYSHIYHIQEHRTYDLTVTVSIRNISLADQIYITRADYYNTDGDNIRQYVKEPISINPMETVEIIISEEDKEGGSGANFVFEWALENDKNPPLFEAVMISTYGQQGLSFTTRGVQIFD